MENEKKQIFEKNFSYIVDELVRQFEVERETFNRLDTKAQFVLGFVGVVFGYLITKNELFLTLKASNGYLMILYYLGLFLVFLAGFLAFQCYRDKKFEYGIEKEQLIHIYRNDGTKDIQKIVSKAIYDASKNNKLVLDLKGVRFGQSLLSVSFGVAFLMIVLSMWCLPLPRIFMYGSLHPSLSFIFGIY